MSYKDSKEITQLKTNENNKMEINDIFNEEKIYYVIDYKNKLEHQNNKLSKPENNSRALSFQKGSSGGDDESNNQSIFSSTNNSGNYYIDNNIEKIISLFMEKLFPKCKLNGFNISKNISSKFFKANGGKIDKDRLEKCINYIHSQKQVITYKNSVSINLEFIENFGYIIMSSYFEFENYKIMNKKELKSNIKQTLYSKQDVLLDFFNYCTVKKYNIQQKKKSKFWEKNAKNYYIPGIFIFLINVFEKIENIEINFEEYNKKFTEEDFDFFVISIINIEYIFYKVNYAKINLNNKLFQKELYNKSLKEYKYKLKKASNNIKKRTLKIKNLYNIKWDFKTNYIINDCNKTSKTKTIPGVDKNNIDDEIQRSKTGFDVSNNFNLPNIESITTKKLSFNKENNNSYDSEKEDDPNEIMHNKTNPDLELISKENNEKENFFNFIKIIILYINGLNKIKELSKIDLMLSNSYTEEINSFFKNEILETDNDNNKNNTLNVKINDFDLLDLLFSKLIKIKSFNCEFNSLDASTFSKIIKVLYINTSIIILNISFFSSDVCYLPQSLYKLYNDSFSDFDLDLCGDTEKKMIDKFLPAFAQNLKNFFDMLRLKSLQDFGINMDIPDIIENNPKYMLLIIKFVINVLLYLYRKDKNNNPIEKVTILCHKLKLNNEYYPFIDKILSDINKNNANNMKELSFQSQFYKVINIKNIIHTSLCILNIGNCDIITFESVVNLLTSYQFSKNSNLRKISLGLVKSIIKLNMEIFSLLFQIFNIKIINLLELNIYSNIIINKDKEYFYFLNIFNNNWISKTVFTLNKKSDDIINMKECINKKNNIKYLVPYNAEIECLSPQEKKKMVNIRKNDEIKNDEVFWILKYIFKIRYSCNEIINRNESLSKFLTNNILSYNHFKKNMDIQHQIIESN